MLSERLRRRLAMEVRLLEEEVVVMVGSLARVGWVKLGVELDEVEVAVAEKLGVPCRGVVEVEVEAGLGLGLETEVDLRVRHMRGEEEEEGEVGSEVRSI